MSNRTFKEELKGCYKFLLKDYQRPQPTKAVVAPRLLEPLSLNKLTNSAQFNSYTFDSTKNININVIKNLLKSKQINHNFLPNITRSSHATMNIFNNPEFIEINR